MAQSIGQRIRALRLERGLTLRDMAERTGMTEASVGRLERGVATRPHRYALRAYAQALGTTAEYLLTGDRHVRDQDRASAEQAFLANLGLQEDANREQMLNLWRMLRQQEEDRVMTTLTAFTPQLLRAEADGTERLAIAE